MQRWADGAGRFELFISSGFEQAPGDGTIPDPVARAIVGALRKIVYTRVREERSTKSLKAEFARLMPSLMEWIASYYPSPPTDCPAGPASKPRCAGLRGRPRARSSLSPPAPWGVRGLPRGEHNLPRGFVVFNQRERIFDAIARLTARDGYQALSLEDIAATAAVSLQTFYTHFENKEEAFLATYEVGHTRAKAAVNRALAHQTEWIGGVRAGATALLEFLASEPALAHLSCVDILIAYPHVAGRVEEANSAYAELLDMDIGEGGCPRMILHADRERGDRRRGVRAAARLHPQRPHTPAPRARRPHQLHRAHSIHRQRGRRQGDLLAPTGAPRRREVGRLGVFDEAHGACGPVGRLGVFREAGCGPLTSRSVCEKIPTGMRDALVGLPPGPRLPRAVQSAIWFRGAQWMLETCQARFGDFFTLKIANEGTWVVTSDPAAIKQVFTGDPRLLHAGEANRILLPVLGPSSVLLLDDDAHAL